MNDTVSDAGSNLDWTTRYSLYQSLLQQTLGSQAASVVLMATEFNSVYTNPGKQSTSLVNGLFVADSLGSLLDSGYSGGYVWDLRNGWATNQNNSNLLYGWREGGDYGMLGSYGQNDPPASNTYIPYPNYFALQLASKIIVAGGQVVSAASSYGDLDVYAVRESDGDLDLLVVNTNPAAAITSQFNVTGFQPGGPVQVWQYGKAQDTAQSLSSNGSASLSDTITKLSLSGADFSYTFPAYSMTVLDLAGSQTLTNIAVASGTLTVAAPAALANGSSLSVGANAAKAFGSVIAAASPTSDATAAQPARRSGVSPLEETRRDAASTVFRIGSKARSTEKAEMFSDMLLGPASLADIAWFIDASEAQTRQRAGGDNFGTIRTDQLLAEGGL